MSLASQEFWKQRLTIPAYRIGEAASYARISPQTVAAWHRHRYANAHAPLSEKEDREGLSFLQLIELAVVAEMRRLGVKLAEIARARDYLKRKTGLDYPFAMLKFKTDGADILHDVEISLGKTVTDKLLASNHSGQYVWTEMLKNRFREFDYGESDAVMRWKVAGPEKDISIDPKLAFGAPQVSGVRTTAIKSRWTSGEEADEIAEDFGISVHQVVEALIFEGMESSGPRISKWIN